MPNLGLGVGDQPDGLPSRRELRRRKPSIKRRHKRHYIKRTIRIASI
jgi:hypothetical protein